METDSSYLYYISIASCVFEVITILWLSLICCSIWKNNGLENELVFLFGFLISVYGFLQFLTYMSLIFLLKGNPIGFQFLIQKGIQNKFWFVALIDTISSIGFLGSSTALFIMVPDLPLKSSGNQWIKVSEMCHGYKIGGPVRLVGVLTSLLFSNFVTSLLSSLSQRGSNVKGRIGTKCIIIMCTNGIIFQTTMSKLLLTYLSRTDTFDCTCILFWMLTIVWWFVVGYALRFNRRIRYLLARVDSYWNIARFVAIMRVSNMRDSDLSGNKSSMSEIYKWLHNIKVTMNPIDIMTENVKELCVYLGYKYHSDLNTL